jgi:hypothetical protein
LEERSTGRLNLYLKAHNIHKTQISMPQEVGYDPAIPTNEQLKTHALNSAALQSALLE